MPPPSYHLEADRANANRIGQISRLNERESVVPNQLGDCRLFFAVVLGLSQRTTTTTTKNKRKKKNKSMHMIPRWSNPFMFSAAKRRCYSPILNESWPFIPLVCKENFNFSFADPEINSTTIVWPALLYFRFFFFFIFSGRLINRNNIEKSGKVPLR